MDGPNFYAPPAAPIVTGPASPIEAAAQAEYAGFGLRAAARGLDWIVQSFLSMLGRAAGMFILVAITPGHSTDAALARLSTRESFASTLAYSLLMSFSYHVFAEWLGGATVGKLLLGLRVRSVALGPCSFGGALLRHLAFFFDSILFGAVAFGSMRNSPTRQRLGDKWGKTVVVKARSLQVGPTPGRLILANAVAWAATMGWVLAFTLFLGL
jgi:uncharacterized RDD family membrane protein YckC